MCEKSRRENKGGWKPNLKNIVFRIKKFSERNKETLAREEYTPAPKWKRKKRNNNQH